MNEARLKDMKAVASEIDVVWLQGAEVAQPESPTDGTHAFATIDGAGGSLVISLRQGEAAGQARRYRLRSVDTRGVEPDLSAVTYLLAVRQDVREAARPEVRRWFDEEHSAAQLGVAGTHWYLGYEGVDEPQYFLNLWGVADPSVVDSKEWAAARDTPWRERLLGEMKPAGRAIFRPVK